MTSIHQLLHPYPFVVLSQAPDNAGTERAHVGPDRTKTHGTVPTFRAFREDFITAVKAEKQNKPKTVQFYTYSFDSLLKYEPLAETRVDNIDERFVQKFTVWALARHCETDEKRTCSVATVNRWRATLRKALRMARRWKYDELAPEPLNSFIQFSCEIGICEREMIDLLKPDVHMTENPDEWGHYGYVHISAGHPLG